jgi:serine/alanine adding enzyme
MQRFEARNDWDTAVLATQNYAHFMQSAAWGQFKTGSGWTPTQQHVRSASGTDVLAVQEFTRPAFGLGTLIHTPRVSGITAENIPALTEHARSFAGGKNLAFKIETYQQNDPELIAAFERAGWVEARPSQYRHSVTVELNKTEEEYFASFNSKARNHLRAAIKAGITVEQVPFTEENIAQMLTLVGGTRKRSGAFFRSHDYLRKVWGTFNDFGQATLYFARHEGVVLAGAVVFTYGTHAWYKDGGSIRTQKRLPAPHLMHWTIINDLQAAGYTHYDLGNIPDPENITDGAMEGLYHFKTGWAPTTDFYMPAFELALNPLQKIWARGESKLLAAYSRIRNDYWY